MVYQPTSDMNTLERWGHKLSMFSPEYRNMYIEGDMQQKKIDMLKQLAMQDERLKPFAALAEIDPKGVSEALLQAQGIGAGNRAALKVVQLGDRTVLADPYTGQIISEYGAGLAPQDMPYNAYAKEAATQIPKINAAATMDIQGRQLAGGLPIQQQQFIPPGSMNPQQQQAFQNNTSAVYETAQPLEGATPDVTPVTTGTPGMTAPLDILGMPAGSPNPNGPSPRAPMPEVAQGQDLLQLAAPSLVGEVPSDEQLSADKSGADAKAKGLTEAAIKELSEKRLAAEAAAKVIETNNYALSQLDSGMFNGITAQPELFASRVLSAAGLSDAETVVNTETFRSIIAIPILSEIKQLGYNPTDADLRFMERAAAGNISLNPDSIRRVLEIRKRVSADTIAKYNNRLKELNAYAGDVYTPINMAQPAPSASNGANDQVQAFIAAHPQYKGQEAEVAKLLGGGL